MNSISLVFMCAMVISSAFAQSQTFCQKYAAVATGGNQTALMQTAITKIALAVATCTNCPTAIWFNGTNNVPGHNFVGNSTALGVLLAHLMGFFGSALGCTDPSFTSTYPVITTNMQAVHGDFQKPVTKAAFEFFNQQAISVLASLGVQAQDLYAVATVLDSFRAAGTGASANNVVCQASDCTTPPFSVLVQDNMFNPPYLTVPVGGTVTFTKTGSNTHKIYDSTNNSACVQTGSTISIDFSGSNPAPVTTSPINSPTPYICSIHCSSNPSVSMIGEIAVYPASSPPPPPPPGPAPSSSAASSLHCLFGVMLLFVLLTPITLP